MVPQSNVLIEIDGFFMELPDAHIDNKDSFDLDGVNLAICKRAGDGKEWLRDLFHAYAGWYNMSHVLKTCYPDQWRNIPFEREWDRRYESQGPAARVSFNEFWAFIQKYFKYKPL